MTSTCKDRTLQGHSRRTNRPVRYSGAYGSVWQTSFPLLIRQREGQREREVPACLVVNIFKHDRQSFRPSVCLSIRLLHFHITTLYIPSSYLTAFSLTHTACSAMSHHSTGGLCPSVVCGRPSQSPSVLVRRSESSDVSLTVNVKVKQERLNIKVSAKMTTVTARALYNSCGKSHAKEHLRGNPYGGDDL